VKTVGMPIIDSTTECNPIVDSNIYTIFARSILMLNIKCLILNYLINVSRIFVQKLSRIAVESHVCKRSL